MNLYEGFKSPDGTRLIWNSPAHERVWRERLARMSETWDEVERASVLEGLRPACQQNYPAGIRYDQMVEWARAHGLFVHPVRVVGNFSGFAHRFQAPKGDGTDLVVTRMGRRLEDLTGAEARLGYPACCEEFFNRHWPRVSDPVWQWATKESEDDFWSEAYGAHVADAGRVNVYCNPMLRYVGARFVPHIPCSTDCDESKALGMAFRELMSNEVRDWIDELLSKPVEWSCLNGVAIVRCEPFRVILGSVPTVEEYIVRAEGRRLPVFQPHAPHTERATV